MCYNFPYIEYNYQRIVIKVVLTTTTAGKPVVGWAGSLFPTTCPSAFTLTCTYPSAPDSLPLHPPHAASAHPPSHRLGVPAPTSSPYPCQPFSFPTLPLFLALVLAHSFPTSAFGMKPNPIATVQTWVEAMICALASSRNRESAGARGEQVESPKAVEEEVTQGGGREPEAGGAGTRGSKCGGGRW